MKILTDEGMRGALTQLGNHLKSRLGWNDGWEIDYCADAENDGIGGILYLFRSSWRIPGTDEYVAFALWWPNDSDGEQPCVQFYLPLEDQLPEPYRPLRRQLLECVKPMKKAGFHPYRYKTGEKAGEPESVNPASKEVPFNFRDPDLPALLSAITNGFEELMTVEQRIEEVLHSAPPPPPPCEREVKLVAILDTEWTGNGSKRKMTQLVIENVIYESISDEIYRSGDEYEYRSGKGRKLDKAKANALLEKADWIVAHKANGDRSLLERELPGIKRSKWLCSVDGGIDWRGLRDIPNQKLTTIAGSIGVGWQPEEHEAKQDVHFLKRILAEKHQDGRTYLARLLDAAPLCEGETPSPSCGTPACKRRDRAEDY